MSATWSGDDSSGASRKAPPKKARSPVASTVSMIEQVLERMPALVAARCLNDAQLLQLSTLSLTAAFGEGPPALQMAPPSQVEARRPVEPSQVVAVASRSLAVEPSQVEASHVSEAAHRIQYLSTMHRFQRLLLHALMMESWAHHQARQTCQAAVPTC